jgi:hypothetical protein
MGWANWFKKKTASSSAGVGKEVPAEGPSMYILALDPHSGAGPYAVQARGSSILQLPAVTTNGRISFLLAGKVEDYNRILADVHNRVLGQPKGSVSYICVATCVASNFPDEIGLVYKVRSFSGPFPELEQIYLLLTNLRTLGDDNWIKTEKYLQSEPVRSWINGFIDGLKQRVNWTQSVGTALESHGDSSRRGG